MSEDEVTEAKDTVLPVTTRAIIYALLEKMYLTEDILIPVEAIETTEKPEFALSVSTGEMAGHKVIKLTKARY